MKYFLSGLKKYAAFSGRASLKEFWLFMLYVFILWVFVNILEVVLLTMLGTGLWILFLSYVFLLLVLLPMFAIGGRRLHDIGKRDDWLFLLLVPVVGWIYLIYLFSKEGDVGANSYGEDPLHLDGSKNI
jgi:uncharacterized membrane protein YhaH (DUF805 family)